MYHWFRRGAAATTGLVFALILLGVYTAASGAGLACSAQWPLCGGGVVPQTWPSFVEWAHRLVAAVTGVAILGVAAAAVRFRGTAPRAAATAGAALAVTPVQVLLGRETIVTYTPAVQTAHHGAALLIFGCLVATTLFAYEAPPPADAPAGAAPEGTPSAVRNGD